MPVRSICRGPAPPEVPVDTDPSAPTEAFKIAVAPLRPLAIGLAGWDLHFTQAHAATVRLAPEGTPFPDGLLDLGLVPD